MGGTPSATTTQSVGLSTSAWNRRGWTGWERRECGINIRQLADRDTTIALTIEGAGFGYLVRQLTLTEAGLLAADLLAAVVQVETPRDRRSEDFARAQHSAELLAARRMQLASFRPEDGALSSRFWHSFYCAACAQWFDVEKGTLTSARKAHRASHA